MTRETHFLITFCGISIGAALRKKVPNVVVIPKGLPVHPSFGT